MENLETDITNTKEYLQKLTNHDELENLGTIARKDALSQFHFELVLFTNVERVCRPSHDSKHISMVHKHREGRHHHGTLSMIE